MAKPVDAADLKSASRQRECGFKSRRPHQNWRVMLAVATLTACAPAAPPPGLPGSAIVRLSDAEAKSLDPQKISDLASLRIAADLFAGLTRLDGAGVAVPALAKDWTVSEDGRKWVFTLRPAARFSDGTAITAETFAQGFARLNAADTAAPTASLFSEITAITASSADRIMITLAHPMPTLPTLLAHPAMAALPQHRIAAAGERWTADRPLVTSGPYRLLQWRLNDRMLLAASATWVGPLPKARQVIWKAVPDKLTALRLIETGAADTAADFPANRVARLRRTLGNGVRVFPYIGSYYFVFNTRRPPFTDVRVRRALSLAIDRAAIAGPLMEIGTPPAWGVLPPGLDGLGVLRPAWADWPRIRRLNAARALLAQAGIDRDHPITVSIRFNSDTDHRRVAIALAEMWRPLGVHVELLNSEAGLHFAALRNGDFAIARSGWIADVPAPENFLAVHLSNAGAINYSGYRSAVYDALYQRAVATANPAARAAAMRAAEIQLIEDAPVLPIYYYVSRNLISARLGGWQDNLSNVHPSMTLYTKP